MNLYQYAVNPIAWIDPWGWNAKPSNSPDVAKWLDKEGTVHMELKGRTWVVSLKATQISLLINDSRLMFQT